MTELKQEARQKALEWNGEKINGKYNRPPIANGSCYEKGYLAGAEPREKRIAELEETINKLREQFALRYDLEDKIKELEAQIEKMKLCDNCKKQGEIITCWKCENHSNWECIK